MGSTGTDPSGPRSVFGTSCTKKKSRYEDEDFSISPPDDSSFFSLRYGAQRKPNESMYDRINKELGLSVEGTKSHLTSEFNIAPASIGSSDGGKLTNLLVGSTGIQLESSIKQQSQTVSVVSTSSSNESPRIIFPTTILGSLQESPEKSCVAQQDVETLVQKVRSGRPTRKISMNLADTIDRQFLESVHDLKIESPQVQEQARPHCPVLPAVNDIPPLAPGLIDSIPVGIRDRRRKTSAPPSLNPMKASNFFFTGGIFSNTATTTASTITSSDSNLSAPQPNSELTVRASPTAMLRTSPTAMLVSRLKPIDPESNAGGEFSLAQTTSLMEQRANEAEALEPRDRMSKRRPKPSTLREMNFWAPQSM